MQRHRFLFIALGLLTVWRLMLLPTMELSPIEALAAFQASHGLQDGWWETGPAVAWTARLGMGIAGHQEWGVRLFAPLLTLMASLAVWRLAKGFFDSAVAAWAVVILNVTPAFHLASLHLTTGTLMLPLVAWLALFIRRGLLQAHPLHWAWWAGGACLAALQHVSSAGVIALAAAAASLAIPLRRRHHLKGFGFFILLLMWLPSGFSWMIWQNQHEWPVASLGNWHPVLSIVPNLFRWVILTSPLLLTFIVLSVRLSVPLATRITPLGFPLGMAIPFLVLDFFWGAADPWPDTGFSVWLLFLTLLVAHRATAHGGIESITRISLRTMMIAFAALQGILITHTDLPRSLGLPWEFDTRTRAQPDYPHYFSRDPSGSAHGWAQSAGVVAAVLRDTVQGQPIGDPQRWFVIANNSQNAAELDFYLPPSAALFRPSPDHPRVHVLQDGSWDQPYAWWPRYDTTREGVNAYTGLHAVYVSDDTELPVALTAQFETTQPISVARVMHGGREVRTLKIFACHRYQPPEL